MQGKAAFQHKISLTPAVWEYYFDTKQPFDYQAGQYISVGLANTSEASRTFTLTSLPGSTTLSFAVKFPTPHSAYKSQLLALEPGDSVTISQAMGDLVLPRDQTRPLIFVAGGLGIASFVSMMRWLTVHKQSRTVTLLYAAHYSKDLLYNEVIAACPGLQTHYFISPHRVDAQTITAAGSPDSLFYLSGSEPFTMGLRQDLLAQGVNPTNVAYDFFDGYKPTDL